MITLNRHHIAYLTALILFGLSVLGACRTELTERRSDFLIHGVDVSHYQSEIDWPLLAEQDIHFAFIKATEGKDLADPRFLTNWQKATENGIVRGAYHFFRPRSPVLQQVTHFVRHVRLEEGDLPPVLDVEVLDGVSPEELVQGVRAWMHLIEAHYNVKPILYTNQQFYNRYLAGHFTDQPLWIARYSRKHPEIRREGDWHFWQYGDRATLAGISGYVDLNVFAGDHASFDSLRLRAQDVRPLPAPMPISDP
jgi:lysozyme